MNYTGHIPLAKPKKSKVVKMEKVMHEFKMGALHSGSKTGRVVTNRKQAVAIAISVAKRRT
jgi:ribosomal protein L21E